MCYKAFHSVQIHLHFVETYVALYLVFILACSYTNLCRALLYAKSFTFLIVFTVSFFLCVGDARHPGSEGTVEQGQWRLFAILDSPLFI